MGSLTEHQIVLPTFFTSRNLARYCTRTSISLLIVQLLLLNVYGLGGCNDVSTAPPPPAGPTALTITTGSPLPNGSMNVPYSTTLAASGGEPPYAWSLANGSPALPDGLTLSPNGVISGTPTAIQALAPIFQVVDSTKPSAQTFQKALTMAINAVPQPTITTPSPLPNGIVNRPYPPTTLTVTGGTPPYTWSPTVTPVLPSGLTFDPATATILGTPTVPDNQTHTFSISDSFSPTPQTATKGLFLTVTSTPLPLTITTPSPLPVGVPAQPYSTTLTATGGVPPLAWDLDPATPSLLPPGLQLSSSGVISGTPTVVTGVLPVLFRVHDSEGKTATELLTIQIVSPPLTITTNSLLPGTLAQPYSTTLTATGGVPPLAWDLDPATPSLLPPGLQLSSSGVISGTPTVVTDVLSILFRVHDSTGQTITKLLMIQIVS